MTDGLMRHQIFAKIRADILSCKLRPGEEIREGELAARFGVSKSPIRDALQKLELEGLVEIEPRRGHRVAPISISDAKDMLDLREILEAGAVRAVAATASEAVLRGFDALRTADTQDLASFANYNQRFHVALCEASGNKRLSDTMARLMENYDRLCVVSLTSERDQANRMEAALADHNTIIDALQSRSVRAVVSASSRHIKKSHSQIMLGLENRSVVA